jgi:hypothetical protein
MFIVRRVVSGVFASSSPKRWTSFRRAFAGRFVQWHSSQVSRLGTIFPDSIAVLIGFSTLSVSTRISWCVPWILLWM